MLKESILNRCKTYSDPFPHWELESPFSDGLIKEVVEPRPYFGGDNGAVQSK